MKIIGCGTANRGDDQAGLAVVEQLRKLGFDAETYQGEPLGIIERWSAEDDVIVVDAVQTGDPPGTLHVWDRDLPQCSTTAVSSHGFDFSKAFELAQALSKLPARLRIYGIEGRHFGQTACISSDVQRAISLAVRQISSLRTKAV